MFRNAFVVAIMVFCSRVLGFLRDIILAALLGTGELMQVFLVAFKLPNMFRDIVAEGSANSSVIPVISEYKVLYGRGQYLELIYSLQAIVFWGLLFFVGVGLIGMPLLIMCIAPGFAKDKVLFDMAVFLGRCIFPFLLFVGFFGINMAILHSEDRFLSTSLGQPMFNLFFIISVVVLGWMLKLPVVGLILGVWLGGIFLVFWQFLDLFRIGVGFNIKVRWHRGLREIALLLGPRLIGTVVYQINVLVDTMLSSLSWIVGSGGIAAIYYASRLMQFPLAMFSVSIAQVSLPKLSRLRANGDKKFGLVFSDAIEVASFLILPSAAFLMAANKLIVEVLFKRGAFDMYSVDITSAVLFYYAFGLFFFSGIKLAVVGFHSFKDTKTPVVSAGICVVLNALLDVILMFPMGISGLALASAISGAVNFFILIFLLNKKIHFWNTSILVEIIKILIASIVVFVLVKMVDVRTVGVEELVRKMLVGLGAFLICCGLLRIRVWRNFVHWVVGKLRDWAAQG